MGILKDSLNVPKFEFLTNYGFTFENSSRRYGESGYIKKIPTDNGFLWITIDIVLKKIFIDGYSSKCHHCNSKEISISDDVINYSPEQFIDWLDEQIG